MADKPTPDDGDNAMKPPPGGDLQIPADGASLRPAMAHRTDHGPMTKAE